MRWQPFPWHLPTLHEALCDGGQRKSQRNKQQVRS